MQEIHLAHSFKQRSILPGFGLTMGYSILYLSLIVLIPLMAMFLSAASMTWSDFWGTVTSPRVLASYKLSLGASFVRRRDQCRLRTPGGVGSRSVRFSGPADRGCDDRLAVCPADRRGRHRPDDALRSHRLDRPAPGTARTQGGLHAPRGGGRLDVHRIALRGAHRPAGAAGFGQGDGGGGRQSRGQSVPDFSTGDSAGGAAVSLDGICHGLCPRAWASTARWSSSRAICRCGPRSSHC